MISCQNSESICMKAFSILAITFQACFQHGSFIFPFRTLLHLAGVPIACTASFESKFLCFVSRVKAKKSREMKINLLQSCESDVCFGEAQRLSMHNNSRWENRELFGQRLRRGLQIFIFPPLKSEMRKLKCFSGEPSGSKLVLSPPRHFADATRNEIFNISPVLSGCALFIRRC